MCIYIYIRHAAALGSALVVRLHVPSRLEGRPAAQITSMIIRITVVVNIRIKNSQNSDNGNHVNDSNTSSI